MLFNPISIECLIRYTKGADILSLVVFLLLRAFEEHIILQNKILERLDYTFKVEEQKRVEDPLSRF